MVDIVAKIVWFRICETAEKLANSVGYTLDFDAADLSSSRTTMDPLGLLLLGWIVLAGVVYFATGHIKDLLTRYHGAEPEIAAGRGGLPPSLREKPIARSSGPNYRPETLSGSGTFDSTAPGYSQGMNAASPQSPQHSPVAAAPAETLQARVKLINYSEAGSEWVNSVLNWLYHRYNTTPEFADIWLSALNEHAKRNAQQLGLLVTFDRFLPTSCAPRIGDVRAELAADEQMSIFCSVEPVQLGFHLLATVTDPSGLVNTNSYDIDIDHAGGDEARFLNIHNLGQQLPVSHTHTTQCFQLKMLIYPSQTNDLLLSAEFERQPRDIRVSVRAPAFTAPLDANTDTSVVQEAVKQCIQNTVTTMRLARFRDFPFPSWHLPSSKPSSPTSSKEPLQTHFPFPATTVNGAKINPFRQGNYQVVVKVVRANSIGDNAVGMEPYCVIEMDEPPQKHTTSVVKNLSSNPVWEERFTLDVSPDSSEMLFELYDRKKPQKRNFLGTAIVSLHELQKSPSQRQIIPLQSRPLMDDLVSGSLTLEFTVLSGGVPLSNNILDVTTPEKRPLGSSNPSSKFNSLNRNSPSPNRGVGSNTTLNDLHGLAAGEFPAGHFQPGTHRVPLAVVQRSHSEDIPLSNSAPDNNHKPKRKLSATDGHIGEMDGSSLYDTDRKERKRKTSFFGRIKRRFSFGKRRSKSLEPSVAKEELRQLNDNTMHHTNTYYNSLPRTHSNGTHHDQGTNPLNPEPADDLDDPELQLAVERGRSRKADRQSRKDKQHEQRSKSAPGSREPSASRSMATSAFGGVTPPLGVMHDDERLHNSLVFLLSTTGTKFRPTWRDKLRKRFSRSHDREIVPTVITTQEVAL